MSIHVTEIRIAELGQAIAFAQPMGCQTAPDNVNHALSLIAREDHQIIGIVLCTSPRGQSPVLDVYVDPNQRKGELTRLLVDKSLLKLQVRGVNKFKIRSQDGEDLQAFYHQTDWLRDDEPETAPPLQEEPKNSATETQTDNEPAPEPNNEAA